jgi:hypothetical protein
VNVPGNQPKVIFGKPNAFDELKTLYNKESQRMVTLEQQTQEELDRRVIAAILHGKRRQLSLKSYLEIVDLRKKQNEVCQLVEQRSKGLLDIFKQTRKDYHTFVRETFKDKDLKSLDVHNFNRNLFVTHKDIVLALNHTLGLEQDLPPKKVIEIIKSWNLDQPFPNFEKGIIQLFEHLNTFQYGIDEETGLSVPALMSSCLSLCRQFEQQKYHWDEDVPGITAKLRYVMIIDQNFTEYGGCFPGFAGRFFATNVTFLCNLLGIE